MVHLDHKMKHLDHTSIDVPLQSNKRLENNVSPVIMLTSKPDTIVVTVPKRER